MGDSRTKKVNCKIGREMGCKTFCCRLIVRLTKEEAKKLYPERENCLSLDKDLSDGLCIFLDKESFDCTIWSNRPAICREYTCNSDRFLQVSLREKFDSIMDLSIKSQKMFIPRETWIEVPEE